MTIRSTRWILWPLGLAAIGLFGACSDAGDRFSYDDMPITTESVAAGGGNSVAMQGSAMELSGTGIAVGDSLRSSMLARADLSTVDVIESKGRVRIISVVPSLDTPVCEQQTHYLSEENQGLDQKVELVTVSVDTPFAQSRFAREAKIENVTFLSDYRGAEFGRSHGLLVGGPHFLARTMLVVDADNVIRYLQVNDELAALPDMEAAFEVARSLQEAEQGE